jgi:hypothetical protein
MMAGYRFVDNLLAQRVDLLAMSNYKVHRAHSVWRRAAGVYIYILSEPQLFIEGVTAPAHWF